MIDIDPTFALGQLRQRMDRELRSLRNSLRSLEDGSYDARGHQGTATGPSIVAGNEQVASEEIAKDECAKSFLSITRVFIDFIDTLIGLKQFIADGVTVERDIASHEELTSYVNKKIAEFAREVGSRTSLTNPRKLERLGNLPPQWQEAVLAYFQVRRTLEHLKQVPDRNIEFRTWRLGVVIDGGEEFQQLPFHVDAGQVIGVRSREETRIFKAGERVILTEEDIEALIQTLSLVVGPELVKQTFPSKEVASDGSNSDGE